MRLQFEAQRLQAIANLDPSKITKSYTRKDWLNDLVDWAGATEDVRVALQPIIYSVLTATGYDAMNDIGLDPSMYDPYSQPLRDFFVARATKIAADINDETAKQLRASLSEGVRNGETTEALRVRVEEVFGAAVGMRADRIARTETAKAQGFADIQAWTQSGVVTAKEFYTAKDERVCPFCSSLNGERIALDENFYNEGETQIVTDDNGKEQTMKHSYGDVPAPPLHPNCRCVLLPVR